MVALRVRRCPIKSASGNPEREIMDIISQADYECYTIENNQLAPSPGMGLHCINRKIYWWQKPTAAARMQDPL